MKTKRKTATFTKNDLMKLIRNIKPENLKLLYDNTLSLSNEIFINIQTSTKLIEKISKFLIIQKVESNDEILIVLHDPEKKLYAFMTREEYILTENSSDGLKRLKRFLLQQNKKKEHECGVCYEIKSSKDCVIQQCHECFNYVCDICRVKMINNNKYECPYCRCTVGVPEVYRIVYNISESGTIQATKYTYSIDDAKAFVEHTE